MMMRRFITTTTLATLNAASHFGGAPSSSMTQIRTVRRLPNKKVIVLKDHGTNLFAHDIIDVKPGYMRNFLYPNRIADYATAENLERHNQTLTPQMTKDLEEKKKGLRITKMLKNMTTLEITRSTKPQIVDVIGQRRELTKKIDLFELCKIISEYFSIVVQPFDILQVYQPDSDRVISDFEKEGLTASGLYDVQFKTSQFSTGVVKLNVVSVVDRAEVERRRLARLERDRIETEQFELEQKETVEREKKREEARARRASKQANQGEESSVDLEHLDGANKKFLEARFKKDAKSSNQKKPSSEQAKKKE